MNWRHWVALWKFRLDNSVSFLVVVNFILLSITASKPIMEFLSSRFGFKAEIYSIVGFLVLIIVICAFLFGYILDKFMRYTQHTMTIQNSRNPELTEILNNTRKILGSVKGGRTILSKKVPLFSKKSPSHQRPIKVVFGPKSRNKFWKSLEVKDVDVERIKTEVRLRRKDGTIMRVPATKIVRRGK